MFFVKKNLFVLLLKILMSHQYLSAQLDSIHKYKKQSDYNTNDITSRFFGGYILFLFKKMIYKY
jgi:hypothetical protein